MQPFRQALDDKDTEALEALLADDVVFSSPMVCSEHPGKAVTIAFLRAVLQVFEDFRCVREFDDVGGRDRAFVLEAEFEGKKVAGCVFLHFDEDGRIDDFMTMVWPPSAAHALEDAMVARIPSIATDAAVRIAGEVDNS